ncbi:Sialic acid-binding periplasmic protein SiaP precursor [Falsiruegeria litorea R37]|uniref:Sialic acid-binding periplasmic protein SiaP n=1 Tax=Falsiruegeria litorea R37 TaxID=1200284 RepID=A0A1Y5U0P0_9RHOB|nr:TRAP transporter substrate-binding protein DctP [Falsiruegeria litorea]SLN73244.1 Sialic acid-binding periplasmic protein SiaP precursor [Falsiruegeria litorea R37]
MKKLIIGTVVSGCLATATSAQVEIKLASIAPAGTPWIGHLETWEKNVEAATNGEIDIVIYPSGQLGNEYDTFKQVQRGRIDAASLSGGVLSAFVPELALMSTPYLFDKVETIDCVYDGAMGDTMKSLVADKDVELLQWGETGWVHVYAQDDLSDVANAEGYKARVAPHDMSRTLWASVGANGTELPYAETPAALQTGLVKAGESAEVSYVAFGLGKVAPHFMMTYHMHQAGGIIISERTMRKLSPEQQQILRDSLPSTQGGRDEIRQMGVALVRKYEAAGGPVHRLTDEQRAAWKAKVEPNWPGFVAGLGGQSEAMWPQVLEAKSACGE